MTPLTDRPRPGLRLPETISAALFDLDGVLTSTAMLHRRAWKDTFDEFLAQRCGPGFRPFGEDDYLRYVDGRPRSDGVREFLRSRGMLETEGESAAGEDESTVRRLGDQKNALLLAIINKEGAQVYPGSVRYLAAVRAAGLKVGVVTSSANAVVVLAATDLTRSVEALIDGRTIKTRGLRGKPAPDAFLAGAEALDVRPARAAVFEDAVAGVAAAHAGAFGFVVGVDRVGDGRHAEELRQAGADVVVSDLSELEATE